MLRSFAEAGNSLDRADYREIAVRNAGFLLAKLRSNGRLNRSYKDGQSRFNAYLEDYACLIDGLVSLYEATFDARWIREAETLSDVMIREFWDSQGGGFYFTSEGHESLIHRPKEFLDNATPSGNSVAAFALLRLWKLTGNDSLSQYPVSILKNVAGQMAQYPSAFAHLLCALDFYLSRPKEIAVIGNPHERKTGDLLGEIFHIYLPNKVVACGTEGDMFLLKDKSQIEGQPTVYVCENFSCRSPVTAPEDLAERLK